MKHRNPIYLGGFAFRCSFHRTPKFVRKTPKSYALMGIRISVKYRNPFGKTPKIQCTWGGSHLGALFARHRNSFAQRRNPTYLVGFAFRCSSQKAPKLVRKTPKVLRTYGNSHVGVPLTRHRNSFVKHQMSCVPKGILISVFLPHDTETRS